MRFADEAFHAALSDARGHSSEALDRLARSYLGFEPAPSRFEVELEEFVKGGRHKVELPEDLMRQVESLARGQNTTAPEIVRRFVNLGLYLSRAQAAGGAEVIVREGDRERELVFL